MNKNQKIVIVIMLLIITILFIYPPTEFALGERYRSNTGRQFLFSIGGQDRINLRNIAAEILVVVCLGISLVILLGLKKKEKKE